MVAADPLWLLLFGELSAPPVRVSSSFLPTVLVPHRPS